MDRDNLKKLIAYIQKPVGTFKFSLVLQEMSWGETLLLHILDLVNPPILRSPYELNFGSKAKS